MEKVELEFVDPIAVTAARLVAVRSLSGSLEYKKASILERKFKAIELCNEAIDEAVDQLIYLIALRETIRKENAEPNNS